MKDRGQLTAYDIGKWLELLRQNNSQPILLLGSRAGALYRSLPFYEYCQLHASQNLYARPRIRSFRECYNLLIEKRLGERELHALLQEAFRNIKLEPYDVYFVELVRRGYFREIISTNMDDIIERAMLRVGLVEYRDFEVSIPEARPRFSTRDLPYKLTKVFGDWLSRVNKIYDRHAYIIDYKELNMMLFSQ